MGAKEGIDWEGRTLKGVVFDLDGTLTNSIEVYFEVFREVTGRVGIHVRREDVFGPLAEGRQFWDQAIPSDLPDRDERIEEAKRLMRPVFLKALHRVRPVPGAEAVLVALKKRGMVLGLVTDSRLSSIEALHAHDLSRFFKAMVTRDDGFPRKPDPAGILECLKQMGIDPSNAVTIGDTLLDIRAGKSAGTLTVGLLSGLASRGQLEGEAPTAILEDVTQIRSIFNL